MELETKLNGFDVELLKPKDVRYVKCNDVYVSVYRIKQLVRALNEFDRWFEVDPNQVNIKQTLFNMVCKVQDIKQIESELP